MLTELYIEALLVDEELADLVWEAWNVGFIPDDLAAIAWWLVSTVYPGMARTKCCFSKILRDQQQDESTADCNEPRIQPPSSTSPFRLLDIDPGTAARVLLFAYRVFWRSQPRVFAKLATGGIHKVRACFELLTILWAQGPVITTRSVVCGDV